MGKIDSSFNNEEVDSASARKEVDSSFNSEEVESAFDVEAVEATFGDNDEGVDTEPSGADDASTFSFSVSADMCGLVPLTNVAVDDNTGALPLLVGASAHVETAAGGEEAVDADRSSLGGLLLTETDSPPAACCCAWACACATAAAACAARGLDTAAVIFSAAACAEARRSKA